MNISERLITIAKFIPNCTCLADIGTDHGYIPIYAIQNGICKTSIASDINKGPIQIADKNIRNYGYEDKIKTRIGPGLSTLKPNEADVILIAGMGGNLIAEIIQENLEIAEKCDYLILQPVQYPEVLRKYLADSGFNIIDEELANEGNKYYHIIKASKGASNEYMKNVYYYTGVKLLEKKHPLLLKCVNHKIGRIDVILNELSNSDNSTRKNELLALKQEFEEVRKWLEAVKK